MTFESPIAAILPSSRKPHELAERFRERHGGIDRVQVVERDRRAERRHALLAALAQPLRAAVDLPASFGPREPALRRDDDVGSADVAQRFRDEPLVVAEVVLVEAVAARGVDVVAAAGDERLDDGERRALVGPALDRQRHASEADGLDCEAPVAERSLHSSTNFCARRLLTISAV